MFATICPICRTDFIRPAQNEVPKEIMDACEPRTGYDRSNAPVEPREPFVPAFDLVRWAVRTGLYTAFAIPPVGLLLLLVLPKSWGDNVFYPLWLIPIGFAVFGEQVENMGRY